MGVAEELFVSGKELIDVVVQSGFGVIFHVFLPKTLED
jgi:hypothetical protein